MQELEASAPAELEIEAPPGLLPNLSEWGIEEIERGVCEDTFDNRAVIRYNKARATTVFDSNGNPTGYIQVISAEMYAAAQAHSKAELLSDPDNFNSDYLNGLELIIAPNAKHLAPTWVLNATRTFMRQQEQRRSLGADAELMQTRLMREPHRCKATKSDGTRCWGWSDGSTDTAGFCRSHARRTGKSNPLGMSTHQIMRNRLLSAAPGALEKMEQLLDSEDERVAQAAAKDLMDRAGFKAVEHVEQTVTVEVTDAAEEVRKRLAKLRNGQEEKAKLMKALEEGVPADEVTVDAEVVEDE